MNHNILKFLKQYTTNTNLINRLIASSYLRINNLEVNNNKLLKSLIINNKDDDHDVLLSFCETIQKYETVYNIESLIELFEFVVSPSDKIVNGAIYTPKYIREYITRASIQAINKTEQSLLIADIACGCGAFLASMAELLHKKTKRSFKQLYSENLYGLDITGYSVTRAYIVLSILALMNNEDDDFDFNIFEGDSLSFDWKNFVQDISVNDGFDIIIGNPPYVCAKNMSSETKEALKRWNVADIGNTDLYIPFFQIGYENLASNGVLCYITVNSFIKSLNGRLLRKYFSENNIDISIIDFGGEQVFKRRTTYTCICTLINRYSEFVKYFKIATCNLMTFNQAFSYKIPYADLNDLKGWGLSSYTIRENLKKIELTGKPLNNIATIRNGFATLMNDLYVFIPCREDEYYFYLLDNDVEYKIERTICRNAIKPNILKINTDINNHIEKLIFPYQITDNNELNIFEEDYLKQNYPFSYKYLLDNKKRLETRDKGKKTYERWYAFGRNQALTLKGYKLLFPYMADKPCFIFTDDQDLLFYNGYAVISDDCRQLKVLEKILNSSIFWYYVSNNSKPYSSEYYAFAKNHIKNFGVCELNEEEKDYLMNTSNMDEINRFLIQKYKLIL